MNRYFLFFVTFLSALCARADSPLTSTRPALAYRHVDLVARELDAETHSLSPDECRFLSAPDQPLDHKMALVNALGWGDTTLAATYSQHLMAKYGFDRQVMDSLLTWRGGQPRAYAPAEAMTADEFACLAYLQAMGDYFRPLKAYYCAYHAADLKPASGAAAYIFGLVVAQFQLDNNWCQVYQVMEGIRTFDGYTVDILVPAAIDNIFAYINLYRETCGQQEMPMEDPDAYHKPAQPQLMEDKKNYVDLEVVSIAAPEYAEAINGSRVVVKVRNSGTISSIATNARLRDLDMTVAEARKRKFSKLWVQAIAENNARANDETGNDVQKGVDYDLNWQIEIKVPVLQPGEETELIFELKNHWIYDSNCEVEIELDSDQNIQEKNEKNNVKAFVAWG